MRLPRKRPARSNDENVVPLINIVFLLLVFFMLAGTLERADPFDVTPPAALTGSSAPEQGVTVLIGPNGELALDAEPISRDTLPERLAALRIANPGQRITVKADSTAPASLFLPVLSTLHGEGFTSLVLLTVNRTAR